MNDDACSTNEINIVNKICRTKYALYNMVLQFIKNRRIGIKARNLEKWDLYMEYVLGNKYFHTSNSHIMLQKTAMEKKSQPYERMGF